MSHHPSQSGFALLITLVVISVVLAIGLSLMQVTLKQLQLTVNARESEVAFYAANAGIECAQAARLTIDPATSIPSSLSLNCFESNSSVPYSNDGDARTRRYYQDFTWNNGIQDLCTEVNIFLLDARGGQYTHGFTNLGLENKTCPNGNICTVMFSTGFNKACDNLNGLQTVQRELTIES